MLEMEIELSQLDSEGEIARRAIFKQPVIKIGRSIAADLRLNSPNVQNSHATIEVHGGEVKLSDLGTGMFHNGSNLVSDTVALEKGDLLRFGDVTVRVERLDLVGVEQDPKQMVDKLKELKAQLETSSNTSPNSDDVSIIKVFEALVGNLEEVNDVVATNIEKNVLRRAALIKQVCESGLSSTEAITLVADETKLWRAVWQDVIRSIKAFR